MPGQKDSQAATSKTHEISTQKYGAGNAQNVESSVKEVSIENILDELNIKK